MSQYAWPVLTRYDQQHLRHIALPLGGIGTGTVSLGGRGDLRDWEIVNRPAKGFTIDKSFFALHVQRPDGETVTRALEGLIPPDDYEGWRGSMMPNHGLPRFRSCAFGAAYPLGQVWLSDEDVPLDVRLEAFNPLVPADADASSVPVAVLRYVLHNKTAESLTATVCGSVQNFIGTDGSEGQPLGNVNEFRAADGLHGILLRSDGVNPAAEQWGTIALTTPTPGTISHRTAWANLSWGDTLLDFWDDLTQDGALDDRDADGEPMPVASLAVQVDVPPHAAVSVTFLLTWHFPNRLSWLAPPVHNPQTHKPERDRIGNHYATQYADAWAAAAATAADLDRLEQQTVTFVRAVCDSTLPDVVKEAALYNLTGLRSQTAFRTEDGYLYGWEGCQDDYGCCFGSCTHVWNYEQATPYLFGDLARGMREVEFLHATDDDGLMSFRVNLPLQYARLYRLAAADGQMGCIMKLYREWQLSGDTDWLNRLYPQARKALEFCWRPGGWDADRDGVMEGCQHNTMDVEYYGPNPQMGFWYLGALRATEEMARAVGDDEFAAQCRDLYERGRAWIDANLFNGDYYEHEIRPAEQPNLIISGLVSDLGAKDPTDPVLQLGAGCLVDQLVGQFMAHVCGLGYLAEPANIQQTLASIMRYNFRETMYGHFNHMRSYVLNDESALLMATYPRGNRPKRPFPYYNEVMTGFEYTAAIGMLYEGSTDDGLRCIQAIRDRYDGRKRSPFDEAECGHHYARAMTSWAALLALTGFHYSAVDGTMRFAHSSQPVMWFWSTGEAWGTCQQTPGAAGAQVSLAVQGGDVTLTALELTGYGRFELDAQQHVTAGESLSLNIAAG